MVQVGGVTYRVERIKSRCYSVVRLLDDLEVGTFRTLPALRIYPSQLDMKAFRDVVRAVLRSARTSSVMQVAKAYAHEQEEASTERSAITVPPRASLQA